MDMEDVPPSPLCRKPDGSLRPDALNPTYRFTLQAISTPDYPDLPAEGIFIPAAEEYHYLPHSALLDWAYGSATIMAWEHGSRGSHHLSSHGEAVQPTVPASAVQEPPFTLRRDRCHQQRDISGRGSQSTSSSIGTDKNNALTISARETMDFFTSLHPAVQIYNQNVMERERA
jgi:hypothetical protein